MRRSLAIAVLLALPAAAQDATPPPQPLKELSWLVGAWNGSGEWPTLGVISEKVTYTWVLGGAFLRGDTEVRKDQKVIWTDFSLVGWDPEKKKLTGWGFGQDGGASRAWQAGEPAKDSWTWEGVRVGAEGPVEFRATMTRTGPDAMTMKLESKKDGAWAPMGSMDYKRHSVDRSDARAVVEGFFDAVRRNEPDAAYALMTPEWAEQEKTWKKSFCTAFFKAGFKLKGYAIREAVLEGDKASVSTKATLLDPEGKEDGEGMRFQLVRKDGTWSISKLE